MHGFIYFSIGASTALAATYFLHTKARINMGSELEHVLNGQVSEAVAKIYSGFSDIATTLKNDGMQSTWEKLCLHAKNQVSETKTDEGGSTDAPDVTQNLEEAKLSEMKSEEDAASNPESEPNLEEAKPDEMKSEEDTNGVARNPESEPNLEEAKPDEMKSEEDTNGAARNPESEPNLEEAKPDEMKSEEDTNDAASNPESESIEEAQNKKDDQGNDESGAESEAEDQPDAADD